LAVLFRPLSTADVSKLDRVGLVSSLSFATSADGTRIAVARGGDGPPLVVVAGAFCDRTSGADLVERLRRSYTVWVYDRRGRGDSDDRSPWSIAREAEDLSAVVSAVGERPFAYGHSSGGALVLEAAAAGTPFRKLAVHEPPYTGELDPGPEFDAQLDGFVAAGEPARAAEAFLALTGAPPPVVAGIRASDDWPRMCGLAHTLSRDRRLGNGGAVPRERFSAIAAQTLALAGGLSAPWAREAAGTIAGAIPGAEARVLEGQHHVPAVEVLVPLLEAYFA
jgi:pimeloyl-ACP methyl ester carboxylesterase